MAATFGSESLGGEWGSIVKPGVATASQRLDVFLIGMNEQLYHYWWPHWTPSGAQWGLESLGGSWPQQSVTVQRWRNRLDAFLIGHDSTLHHFWQLPGEAFQSRSLGGDWPLGPLQAV